MKKRYHLFGLLFPLIACLSSGCLERKTAPVCPAPVELSKESAMAVEFSGLDMVIVVDNSGSMEEENKILATAIYKMINTLANNPDPNWEHPDVEDIRIGVTSTDIGLQFGVNGDLDPDASAGSCRNKGNDGRFIYPESAVVELESGSIPCLPLQESTDSQSTQCPLFGTDDAWLCQDKDQTGKFKCYPKEGNTNHIECDKLGSLWAFTPGDPTGTDSDTTQDPLPNWALPLQIACATDLGPGNCGIEQQMQASRRTLARYKDEFIREDALLAILVVSDEEDCSILDSALFKTDDWKNKLNIACAKNPNYMFRPEDMAKGFAEAAGKNEAAVVFAAIVGVPLVSECQGLGADLAGCLAHEKMKLAEVYDEEGRHYRAEYACERYDTNDPSKRVTEAGPGRRYVEVAQEMGNRGYVYSICNEDWTPAVEEISKLIAQNMGSSCFPKPLTWLPDEKIALCDAVIVKEIEGKLDDSRKTLADWSDICGFEPEDIPPVEEIENKKYNSDETYTSSLVYCPLPKLSAPIDCASIDPSDYNERFGWYYCEDNRENFKDACVDKLDNDNDGLFDCDDPDCASCTQCGGKQCEGEGSCRYSVRLTNATKSHPAVKYHEYQVQCLQQFQFNDINCKEATIQSCGDGIDNDGNGVFDCDGGGGENAWRFADPTCCPMTPEENVRIVKDKNGIEKERHCVLTNPNGTNVFQNTCSTEDGWSQNLIPDACRARAAEADMKCQLP